MGARNVLKPWVFGGVDGLGEPVAESAAKCRSKMQELVRSGVRERRVARVALGDVREPKVR